MFLIFFSSENFIESKFTRELSVNSYLIRPTLKFGFYSL